MKTDLEILEAVKQSTLGELVKQRDNLDWIIRNFERPEFEEIYRMKRNGHKFEFAPVSVQQMLLRIIKEEMTSSASILLNIDMVIEKIERGC